MQYTKLGNTGVTVSRLCFGCMTYGGGPQPSWAMRRDWALGEQEAREHFAVALEAGINFFDTADVYSVGGSEEITGKWLKEMASRDDIVVATKVFGAMGPGPNRRGLSRKHIIEAIQIMKPEFEKRHIEFVTLSNLLRKEVQVVSARH